MNDLIIKSPVHIENVTGVMTQLSETDPKYKSTKYWRNLRDRARRSGYPILKQILVDHIKNWMENYREYCKPRAPALSITMSCGNSVSYQTFDDIPEVDVPCPCGDKSHWFIRYMDLRKQ